MSLLAEGLVALIGEGAAYMVGRIVGRCFYLDEKQAQRLGEYILIALFAVGIFTLTLVYS